MYHSSPANIGRLSCHHSRTGHLTAKPFWIQMVAAETSTILDCMHCEKLVQFALESKVPKTISNILSCKVCGY